MAAVGNEMPSLKAEKLVRALANPKTKTITEAAAIAGYADRPSASRVLRNAKVQTELRRRIDLQADKARQIEHLSSEGVLADLPDAQPEFKLAAWKVSRDVINSSPPQTEELTPKQLDEAAAMVLHAAMLGARLGAKVGRMRASELLGSLLPEGTHKVYAIKRLRDMVLAAQGLYEFRD